MRGLICCSGDTSPGGLGYKLQGRVQQQADLHSIKQQQAELGCILSKGVEQRGQRGAPPGDQMVQTRLAGREGGTGCGAQENREERSMGMLP